MSNKLYDKKTGKLKDPDFIESIQLCVKSLNQLEVDIRTNGYWEEDVQHVQAIINRELGRFL